MHATADYFSRQGSWEESDKERMAHSSWVHVRERRRKRRWKGVSRPPPTSKQEDKNKRMAKTEKSD